MTKRNPTKTKPNQQPSALAKRTATFRTAIPLLLTLVLLAVIYVFVLLPDSPSNSLKGAILNSFDPEKQTSYRYDGSFGDTNRGIEGEYGGQKASNGDSEFRVRLKNEEIYTSLETINIGDTSYLRIEGVENLNTILAKITGVKKPSDEATGLLLAIQSKWIELTPATKVALESQTSCINYLPGFGNTPSAPKLTADNYPFELKSGPSKTKDDSEDRTYEAVLIQDRAASGPEEAITSLVNCLESSFGEDDYRLRDSGKVDEQSMRFVFTVDPLSNTVTRMVVKQVGQYFQLVMRDYNKDVTITAPDSPENIRQVYLGLSPAQQSFLIGQAGIDIGSVLQ